MHIMVYESFSPLYSKGSASKRFHHNFQVETPKHWIKATISSKESTRNVSNRIIEIKIVLSELKVNETEGGGYGRRKEGAASSSTEDRSCSFPLALVSVPSGLVC